MNKKEEAEIAEQLTLVKQAIGKAILKEFPEGISGRILAAALVEILQGVVEDMHYSFTDYLKGLIEIEDNYKAENKLDFLKTRWKLRRR